MQYVDQFINSYFDNHKNQLENHYPGLNSLRLLRDFLVFTHLNPNEIYLGQGRDFFLHLEEGYPLEYIQNNAFFFRSNFYVNDDVLIPRSETEILVEDGINFIKKNYHKNYNVAEIGVGSFCIGLSILIDMEAKIDYWGCDISLKALEVARVNLFRLNSKINSHSNVELVENDCLNKVEKKFDFIVSNPPYIKKSNAKETVHTQTDAFEPHVALYLEDEDYISWFDKLFREASSCLTEVGAFFMEGHEDHLEELEKLSKKYFKKSQIKKDYNNRDRFLYLYK